MTAHRDVERCDVARLACILAGLAPADRGFLEALLPASERRQRRLARNAALVAARLVFADLRVTVAAKELARALGGLFLGADEPADLIRGGPASRPAARALICRSACSGHHRISVIEPINRLAQRMDRGVKFHRPFCAGRNRAAAHAGKKFLVIRTGGRN